jgi:glycosyltransferase involved in cell wall biosynthesis
VATVYDLSPLHYDDEGRLPPWFEEVIARAALLLTPSEFTASELTNSRGVPAERIRVFGLAPVIECGGLPLLSTDELAELGIRSPFVLRSGGYTQRKNVALLLKAWRDMGDAVLVLVGPAQPARDHLLADMDGTQVVVLDYVPETLLARLMRSAAVLVSPSLYEGFGLPQLEAMAAGTPVVAVRTPFAEEVCGDAALLVETDPVALRNALVRVLDDRKLASNLSAAGLARSADFTWQAAAARVTSAYREALAF